MNSYESSWQRFLLYITVFYTYIYCTSLYTYCCISVAHNFISHHTTSVFFLKKHLQHNPLLKLLTVGDALQNLNVLFLFAEDSATYSYTAIILSKIRMFCFFCQTTEILDIAKPCFDLMKEFWRSSKSKTLNLFGFPETLSNLSILSNENVFSSISDFP